MRRLRIGVAVLAALGKRDDMIDMEISAVNGLSADATNTLIALEKDLSIYVLYKLLALPSLSL